MLFSYKQVKSLNGTEKTILQNSIENLDEVLKMNIRDFADLNFVSTASIVRFYKKLGCKGFNEFKEKLHQYKSGIISMNATDSYYKMQELYERIISEEFNEKVQKIKMIIESSKCLLFLGIGNSGALATYGARYFSNLGYFALAITDPFQPTLLHDNNEYALIVLTESGETKEVLDQVRLYHDHGTRIIAITNTGDSTINHYADVALHYDVDNSMLPQTFNLTTQVPVVAIIEYLGRALETTPYMVQPIWPSSLED